MRRIELDDEAVAELRREIQEVIQASGYDVLAFPLLYQVYDQLGGDAEAVQIQPVPEGGQA